MPASAVLCCCCCCLCYVVVPAPDAQRILAILAKQNSSVMCWYEQSLMQPHDATDNDNDNDLSER